MAHKEHHEKHTVTDSVTHFVTKSLDNLKKFVDHTADEVAKADVVGANRRILDQIIEGTKDTVTQVAENAARNDAVQAARCLATGMIENAKQTVRVASEESQRINLVETGAKVTQEGLELVKRQLDLGFEAGTQLSQAMEAKLPKTDAIKRPGPVTRVEIESDKGSIKV